MAHGSGIGLKNDVLHGIQIPNGNGNFLRGCVAQCNENAKVISFTRIPDIHTHTSDLSLIHI